MRLSYFFILILVVRLFWMRNICARESTLKKRSKNTFYKFFPPKADRQPPPYKIKGIIYRIFARFPVKLLRNLRGRESA